MNIEKERKAINALKAFEPETEPYYLCYSGGKDSDVIRILVALSGVKHEIHHNLTSVDAPETIKYIKSIPNVIIDKPRYSDGSHKTMWNLIPKKKFVPTRVYRFCCSELKEFGGKNRLKITGVRASESISRSLNGGEVKILGKPKHMQQYFDENDIEYEVTPKGGIILNFDNSESRRAVEYCFRTTYTSINPILDWTDSDVWSFLNHYGCSANPLYQCGEKRIGCIGCPLSGSKSMKSDFYKYPKYKENYIRAFDKMLKARESEGKENYSWTCGEDVFNWWLDINTGQLLFDGFDYLVT